MFVIEVNPRSSRTVPFLSKITNIPMARIATNIMLGKTLEQLGFKTGVIPVHDGVFVKVPVFSFAKLRRVDISLGPEMKSTGEVMGKDKTLEKALYKALVASGMKIKTYGSVIMTIADKDKEEASVLAKRFQKLGYQILATKGTAKYLQKKNISAIPIDKISDNGQNNLLHMIRSGQAQLVVNTLTKGKEVERDGFKIRREAVENSVPCLTSLDTVDAILNVLESIIFSVSPIASSKKNRELVYQ